MGFFSNLGGVVGGALSGAVASGGNPWGAAAGAALGAFGDQLSANSASSKNKREAQRNRDWQTYMSNTAIQRQVKDMVAAGYNPILAVHGSGAPMVSSALGSATSASGSFGNGISNATRGYEAKTHREIANAQIVNLGSASGKNAADADLARVQAQNNARLLPEMIGVQRAQARMYDTQALNNMQNAALARLSLPAAAANAAMYDSWYGQSLPYINSAIGIANGLVGVVKPVVQMRGAPRVDNVTRYDRNGEVIGGQSYHFTYH